MKKYSIENNRVLSVKDNIFNVLAHQLQACINLLAGTCSQPVGTGATWSHFIVVADYSFFWRTEHK